MIGKSTLCICLLLGASMTATAQSWLESMGKCKSADPDTRIAGCTAVIQGGLLTKLLNPENLSIIYNNRGTAFDNKRDHDHAIQDYNEAIRLSPNHAYTYYGRGSAYLGKGDFDHAIQDLTEAIRLDPKYSAAYHVRGNAFRRKHDYDQSIQDLNEALRLNPNDAGTYYARGSTYLAMDDYNHAIQDYDQSIRLDPKANLSAFFSRGSAYYSNGKYDRAIQNYDDAIRINPKFALAYEKRGDAYFAQSNLKAATADFEQTISTAPSSTTAVFAALMLHVIMKRQGHDDAQQLARVATAADLSQWPGPVLKLVLGHATADEVLKAAANTGPDLQKWQVCEANYLTGEDALLHHQRAMALARLKAARDGCPKDDTDYTLTLVELQRLGAAAAPTKK